MPSSHDSAAGELSNDDIPEDEMLLAEVLAAQLATIQPQGHMLSLRVAGLHSGCGNIVDGQGIAFAFEGQGCWVLSREELRALVAAADALDKPSVRAAFRCAMEES